MCMCVCARSHQTGHLASENAPSSPSATMFFRSAKLVFVLAALPAFNVRFYQRHVTHMDESCHEW